MLLLGLVKSVEHVCCRYRLAAFQSLLKEAGHHLELRAWPKSWLGRLRLRPHLRAADVVIVQRRLMAAWEMLLLRRSARRLVFDLDDAIFQRDSYARPGLLSSGRQHGFTRMVRAADLVVAGNDFLGDRAAAEVGAHRVLVVPTCVDPDHYPLARHYRKGRGVRLVWIGSASTLQGLEHSADLWNEIGRRCPGVSLKLICDKDLPLTHLPVQFCRWSEATETEELASADIGVSWLPNDSWSRGKCGLKVLQYMAAGLPVVANSVGVQADLVRHGETGFLADTPEEWCEAISRLTGDPALRQRLGHEGRRDVESDFNIRTGAERWVNLLDSLCRTLEAVA